MPLISRSDCELNAYDRTFFVVDVTFAYDPGDFPGGGWFGAITNCCRVSADDDRVGIRLEAWDDVPEEPREPWADVASGRPGRSARRSSTRMCRTGFSSWTSRS
ncbi:hypothetical protein ABT061_02860 [Streptosporangium sp. NPDC002544]|uniref:hypothetical protein n=1 Tax=Streptosporangium sp. NPDC002544 TaxID=3154538 RepID=UPI00332731A6